MANTRKLKVILYDQDYPGSVELRKRRMGLWEQGVTACGDQVEYVRNDTKQFGDVCITWGPRTADRAHQKALHHLVMECGFFGDRLDNFFVGYSGLNGVGKCPLVRANAGKPYYDLLKPQPKRERHQNVVIFGQVAQDANLLAMGAEGEGRVYYYRDYLAKVADYFERNGLAVGFRGHPSDTVWTNMVRPNVFSFDEAGWDKARIFEWADLAFAFSSNSLVEAYCEGLDVIPAHPGSLCWDVRSAIHHQHYAGEAGRKMWVDYVASHQWSSREIASGEAWQVIRKSFAR